MCFYTKLTKTATEVESRFQAKLQEPSLFHPQEKINGFGFPETPVILAEKPQMISLYSWGLVPAWAKDKDIQKYTLNAKIETVNEKPSFKNSVHQRCLVIANGYYEWQWLDAKGKTKQPYELCLPNEELFAFAGLYSQWVDASTGEIKNTYTILTTEASPLLAEIHNHKKRMPVVLNREDETRWLQHEPIQNFAYPYNVDLIAIKL
jgi:putative SOS response-associated peptidase YedK